MPFTSGEQTYTGKSINGPTVDNPDGDPRGVGYTHTVFAAPDRLSTATVGYNMVWLSIQPTTHVMPQTGRTVKQVMVPIKDLSELKKLMEDRLNYGDCKAAVDNLIAQLRAIAF